MTLPVVPVERPLDLIGVSNGQLAASLLTAVGPSGVLHHTAARAWRALQAAARGAGFSLTYTYGGTYRTYSQQEQLFRQRYTLTVLAGRPTKQWQGRTWYQLPNTAMAAVPGTSNHGLGIAVDTAIGPDPAHAVNIDPRLGWMEANAPRFGWSWENYETWHIRYVTGDRIPAAVVAYELGAAVPAPVPQPTPTPLEDDMQTALFRKNGKTAIWKGDGRSREHITSGAQLSALTPIYGPVLLLDESAALDSIGAVVVGNDPGDI